MAADRQTLLAFIRAHGLAVVSTVSAGGAPEAALVNIAVTDDLELVFYTLQTTRKCANLRRDPRIAVVIGWDDETTLQCDGTADEPRDEDLERLKQAYRAARPDAAFQMTCRGSPISASVRNGCASAITDRNGRWRRSLFRDRTPSPAPPSAR